MATPVTAPVLVEYRNFNICPHCERLGVESTLDRMSEGMPMISRSDGKTFHLLLADRPLPFPMEKGGCAGHLSLCFWYVYENGQSLAGSAVVLLHDQFATKTALFRQIEHVADLLVMELLRHKSLSGLYGQQGASLRELRY